MADQIGNFLKNNQSLTRKIMTTRISFQARHRTLSKTQVLGLATLLMGISCFGMTTVGSIDESNRINDGVLQYSEIPGSNALEVSRSYDWPDGGIQDLEIPDSVNLNGILRPVTTIGSEAFDCSNVKGEVSGKITIPTSVNVIKSRAFLANPVSIVILPDSVQTIGESAFYGCTNLTSAVIPTGTTTISEYAFANCDSLESVTFQPGIRTIGASAFQYCRMLAELKLPSELAILGDSAFKGCNSLKSVSLPGKVSVVGSECFSDCTALESVIIPASVSKISLSSFNPCIRLGQVTFLGSLPSIQSYSSSSFPETNPARITIFCKPRKGFESFFADTEHYQIKYLSPDLVVSASSGKIIKNNGKAFHLGSIKKGRNGSVATFKIRNNGIKPLHISKVRLSGKGQTSFKILSYPKTTIAAGQSSSLRVRFQPVAMGELKSSVQIKCDDPFESLYLLNLSGLGR